MEETTFLAINQQKDLRGGKNKPVKGFKAEYRYILLVLLGFLMGRAELFPGFYPLALVYWALISRVDRYLLLSVTLTIGLGLIWGGDYLNLIYLISGFIALALYRLFIKYRKFFNLSFWVSIVFLFFSLMVDYYQQAAVHHYLLSCGESLLIYILINLGCEGMDELYNPKKKLTWLALITIFIMSSGAVAGLANFHLIPREALIVFLLLIFIGMARTLGFIYSVTGAVLYGLVMVSTGIIPILSMVKFIILAAGCGLFQKKNKLWMMPGILLAFFVYSGFSPTIYDLRETAFEFASAGILFLIIPDNLWQFLFSGLIKKDSAVNKYDLDPELAGSLSQHLNELSEVFHELSATFREVISEKQGGRFDDFIYIFKNKLCRHCQRAKICWHQEGDRTREALETLAAVGEEKGTLEKNAIESYLGRSCVYSSKISNAVKSCFDLFQINKYWRDKLTDKQEIVSDQLAGVGEMLEQFSRSSRLSPRSNDSLDRIMEMAREREIELSRIKLSSNLNTSKLNLEIEMEPCAGNNPCEEQLMTLLNSEYDSTFRILERRCGDKLKDRPCKIIYGARGSFFLDLAVIQKSSDKISGDSYLHRPMRDGEDLIVLSDGMGTGKKAARESKAAINLLTSILDAGFDQKLAIKTINSALFLRSEEESFTTLDVALFDTFTGQITFSKIGAVASYVKRGWELFEIESSSLPVGIINRVEVKTRSIQLEDGDFVIMITDGVLDTGDRNEGPLNGEEMLKQLLQNSSFEQAGDLADYLVEVIMAGEEELRDDLTIIVVKVEEILQKRRKFKV